MAQSERNGGVHLVWIDYVRGVPNRTGVYHLKFTPEFSQDPDTLAAPGNLRRPRGAFVVPDDTRSTRYGSSPSLTTAPIQHGMLCIESHSSVEVRVLPRFTTRPPRTGCHARSPLAHPNPSRGSVALKASPTGRERVTLTVLNVRGQRVWQRVVHHGLPGVFCRV